VVSDRLATKVRGDVPTEAAEEVLRRLDALHPVSAEGESRERIQAAIVLLAEGHPAKLEHYASVAETDWRDVLFWSSLGHDDWAARLDEELAFPPNPSSPASR
jgi:hypothetical protein